MLIYTVLMGKYDKLQTPEIKGDFYCLTDQPEVPEPWKIITFETFEDDLRKASRFPKILSHLFFPWEETLYIDANVKILGLPKFKEPFCVLKHPDGRGSVFNEGDAVVRLGKDKKDIVLPQLKKYMKEKLPSRPIPTCSVIYRNKPINFIEFENLWWREVVNHSHRDQLSFYYAAWKSGLRFSTLDINYRNSKYFKRFPHEKS